jgi:hypothetical protein
MVPLTHACPPTHHCMIGSATIDLCCVSGAVGRAAGWMVPVVSRPQFGPIETFGWARPGRGYGLEWYQPVQFGDFGWVVVGVADFHNELIYVGCEEGVCVKDWVVECVPW